MSPDPSHESGASFSGKGRLSHAGEFIGLLGVVGSLIFVGIEVLSGSDFLYGGYSAGACVLAPSLVGIRCVDDPEADPYGVGETIWDGLSLLDYLVLPHYRSDHPESGAIDGEVDYCVAEGRKVCCDTPGCSGRLVL